MITLSKTKLLATLLIIIVGSGSFYLGEVLATPSPSINRIVTPGAIGPCAWFVSLDGTTPIAEAMVGGLSVGPGDNIVGTAAQDFSTFYASFASANQNICFSSQSFTLKSIWTILTGDTISGSGVGNTIFTTSGTFGGASQAGVLQIVNAANVKLTGLTLALGAAVSTSGISITASTNTIIDTIQITGSATGAAQVVFYSPNGVAISYHNQILRSIFSANTLSAVDFEITGSPSLINETLIQGNRFENSKPYGVKFSENFGTVIDTKIDGNTCYNLITLGAGGGQQATCVSSSGAQVYTMLHTIITNNFYYNSRINTPQGEIGILSQGENDTQIIGNRFINLDGNSVAFAPGQQSVPDFGFQLIGNYVEGWGSFWDPNSMEYVIVKDNIIVNCKQNNGGLQVGYNRQMHEIIKDNIFVNCQGVGGVSSGAIFIAGVTPPALDILIQGNLIVDNRTTPMINTFLYVSGSGLNSSDVTIKDNKVWVPKATISYITLQNTNDIPPRIVTGNTILTNGVQLLPLKITNPFGTVGSIANAMSPYGSAASPTASTVYTVYGGPFFLSAAGGATLSITITDVAGNNLFTTGQTSLQGFPIYPGYKINFGAFTGGPTFIVEIPY